MHVPSVIVNDSSMQGILHKKSPCNHNQNEITWSFPETTFIFFWQHLDTEPSKGHSEGKTLYEMEEKS